MKNFARITSIIYLFSLLTFLPARASDLSNGLVVKLSAGTTVEQFLYENNLKSDQIEVGQEGYLLLKTYKLPSDSQNNLTRRVNSANYGLAGAEQATENYQASMGAVIPNDPYYPQWNLEKVAVNRVWDDTTGTLITGTFNVDLRIVGIADQSS